MNNKLLSVGAVTAIGVAFGNMALGVSMGAALGAVVGAALNGAKRRVTGR